MTPRLKIETVRAMFEKEGCELLDEDYKGNRFPVRVKFACGCEGAIALSNFSMGTRCSTLECVNKRKAATCVAKYGTHSYMDTSECKERRRASSRGKYGVDFPSQSAESIAKRPEMLAKMRATNLQIYGVPVVSQNAEVMDNMRQTNVERYGVPYVTQNAEIRERVHQTHQERFGSHSSQNADVVAKMHKTNVERYGAPVVLQNAEVREKARQTTIERFGVPNALQNAEVFSKHRSSCYSSKDYTFPSGRVVTLMGYEGLAIDRLLAEGIAEADIEVDARKMPTYNYVGVNAAVHRYFPDIWIAKDNLIVEVKSKYTYEIARDVTELKRQAVEAAGQRYRLMIMDGKGNLL